MITTKRDFEIVVEMYQELKELVEGLGKCDHSVGICACGLYDLLEKGKNLIEKSAGYLGYIEKKGLTGEWGTSKKKKVE